MINLIAFILLFDTNLILFPTRHVLESLADFNSFNSESRLEIVLADYQIYNEIIILLSQNCDRCFRQFSFKINYLRRRHKQMFVLSSWGNFTTCFDLLT